MARSAPQASGGADYPIRVTTAHPPAGKHGLAAGNSRLALMEKPPYLANYVTVRFVTGKVDLPADSRAMATGRTSACDTPRINNGIITFSNAENSGKR